MQIELRDNSNQLEAGDAIVFNTGIVRIIVEVDGKYGAYAPEEDRIYYSESKSVSNLISRYCERDISRYIKKHNLKIVEV